MEKNRGKVSIFDHLRQITKGKDFKKWRPSGSPQAKDG